MKRALPSLLAVVLLLGLTAAPVNAGEARQGSERCGLTYTVQHLDNLTKIAEYCQTTVEKILAYNPQITNPNLIYSGQVLNMTNTKVIYETKYTVQAGDTLSEIASLFDITVWDLRAANQNVWFDSDLTTGMVLNIPDVSNYAGYSGNARVSLSVRRAGRGDTVTVYVRGFPANAWIDYRIGEQRETYSAVYDGIIGPDGTDNTMITIPDNANEGELWVVLVTTTSQRVGVEATSPTIVIDN
jgi:LysM repeat protein